MTVSLRLSKRFVMFRTETSTEIEMTHSRSLIASEVTLVPNQLLRSLRLTAHL